jgi:hypothetical protein
MAYFFLDCLTWVFTRCIFFRRWANLVAGLRDVCLWFLDMVVILLRPL